MPLPTINISVENSMSGLADSGTLLFKYNPFHNLINTESGVSSLTDLQLSTTNAELSINKPIEINTEVSFDNSVNLIVSDGAHPPKIINSRFYLKDSTTYAVSDRRGNLDTNIYSKENFKSEASLIKSVKNVITLDFLGIKDGGTLKVGNYTFYFKLADYDGNESDFISESGKVVCHIGSINVPSSIRGGQLDEDSGKLIKFRLNNLDLAFNYINIYYTRSSGDGNSEIVKSYQITDKFKITNNSTEISITGYENIQEISLDDINVKYTNFNSVETLSNCQNITFAGNITNNYEVFKTLEKYSLLVYPTAILDKDGIGLLDESYIETYPSQQNGYEYYNVNNIYYKLGY